MNGILDIWKLPFAWGIGLLAAMFYFAYRKKINPPQPIRHHNAYVE